jgi:pimeloyl-ACP methyl ester carboxylesterase
MWRIIFAVVALILLFTIGVEAALFGLAGAWLLPARWVRWPQLLACSVGGIVFVRAAMVALSYHFAWRARTPREEHLRLGLAAALSMFAREVGAQVLAFGILQPLAVFFTPRDEGNAGSGTPILLVHGLWCNAAVWWRLARRLRESGAGPVFTLSLEPPLADIDLLARQLQRRIEEVCAASGASRIALVAHSMGGLVARAYLRRWGTARLARLVTLGSPHQGSALAALSFGRSVEQMRPGNPWLEELAKGEAFPAEISCVSLYSVHDNLVAPQASSALPHMTNIPLAGVGHVELLFRRDVADRVVALLRQRSPGQSENSEARAA